MGVLALGSAHARPSARPPIDMSENFPAHMSAESLFEISPFSGQNRVILGGRGVPEFFFLLESSYFCYLGAHAKFQIPTICPYWGLATAGTRKEQQEKKRKNIKNSGLRRFDETVCTAPLGPISKPNKGIS